MRPSLEEANRLAVIRLGGRMHRAKMLVGHDGFAVTLCGLESYTRADYSLDEMQGLPWALCRKCSKRISELRG